VGQLGNLGISVFSAWNRHHSFYIGFKRLSYSWMDYLAVDNLFVW